MAKASTFAQRLQQLLDATGINQAELSRRTKISKSNITRYLKGEYEAKQDGVYAIAQAFSISESWLMGYDVPMKPDLVECHEQQLPLPDDARPYNPTHRIPILGRISAGLPLYAEEHIEGYTYTELNHGGEYFALRVRGDSMNALDIRDGYLVIVRRQDYVDNGAVAAVLVGDDEATLKRFYRDGDVVTLMPQSTNPAHMPQIYNTKDTLIRIIGEVIEVKFTL